MTLFLVVIAFLAFLAALWPFGFYQASLMLARRLHRFPATPAVPEAGPAEGGVAPEPETFAICLCAYNEISCIRQKVEDLLRLRERAGRLDILVYVDAADDGTSDVLREYVDRIFLHVSPERHGKTHGMNMLVKKTDASIVMFTDANVLIDPQAAEVLRRYFADPAIGCVCSNLTYVNAEDSATAEVGSAFWRFNEWSKGLETATGSVIGADGSLFAIRRRLHRQVPNGLFDDIFVSLGVLLQGFRVVRAPELKAFETHSTKSDDEYRRKIRIACECMHVHYTLWPELRRLDAWNLYKYLGHRWLRWVGGYFMLFGGVVFFAALVKLTGLLAAFALAVAVAFGFALAIRWEIAPALKFWNVVLAFAGNTVGVWRAMRGERSVTWSAPESSRQATLVSEE